MDQPDSPLGCDEFEAGEAEGGTQISERYFFVAPVAVLAALLLFRFVGCQKFEAADDSGFAKQSDGNPDYVATIMRETSLVSYWRLQEPANLPTPGTAKDEKGANPGTYKKIQLAQDTKRHSPATDAPGTRKLGVSPGLLGFSPSTPLEANGGFVEVVWNPMLNTTSFTLEALVVPEWDPSTLGLYYCLIESGGPVGGGKKTSGYAVYAGPEDPPNLNTPYRWQVWVGSGTGFTQVKNTNPSMDPGLEVKFGKMTYIAITCDGTTLSLYSHFEGKDIDLIKGLEEPITFNPNLVKVKASFLIGIGRSLFPTVPVPPPAAPLLYPFKGKIQEVAFYNTALTAGNLKPHGEAACKNLQTQQRRNTHGVRK